MTLKALLLDFDGTLVTRDMLSEVIDLVGQKMESEQIDNWRCKCVGGCFFDSKKFDWI